jgi:hypothetical protein
MEPDTMSTAMAQPAGADASHEPLSMFYLRAENEDGHDLDLAVVATTQTAAVDLWSRHYFDDNKPIAEQWAASGRGVMTLAMSADRDQRGPEPGAIDWALEPFRYPSN